MTSRLQIELKSDAYGVEVFDYFDISELRAGWLRLAENIQAHFGKDGIPREITYILENGNSKTFRVPTEKE